MGVQGICYGKVHDTLSFSLSLGMLLKILMGELAPVISLHMGERDGSDGFELLHEISGWF